MPGRATTSVGSSAASSELVNGVVAVSVTVLVSTEPLGMARLTRTKTWISACWPAASWPTLHMSTPAGVSTQPPVLLWKVTPAGSASRITTPRASLGPVLVTTMT
jgi:hypothetical protein